MAKGILYIMTSSIPEIIKIGITTNFESRMNQLERNGYYNISGWKRHFAIEVDDYKDKERMFLTIFGLFGNRLGDSEALNINNVENLSEIVRLFSALDGKEIYPNKDKNETFQNETKKISQRELAKIPDGIYYFKPNARKKLQAILEVKNHKFFLKKGSEIRDDDERQKGYKFADKKCLQGKVINGILQEDVECSTPSQAGELAYGNQISGWYDWYTSNGEKLVIYRR